MQRTNLAFLTLTLLLLGVAPAALAHGHDESEMDMNMSDPGASTGLESKLPDPSYFGHGQHKPVIFAHIILMVLAWVCVLPIGVMLSIARSRFTLPAEFLFLLVNAFGLLTGFIYNHQTPDLYENNVHHGAGWVITFIAIGWFLMAVVRTFAGRTKHSHKASSSSHSVTQQAMAEHRLLHSDLGFENTRWSSDSGQGTERNTDSLCDSPRNLSLAVDGDDVPAWKNYKPEADDVDDTDDEERPAFLHNSSVARLVSRKLSHGRFSRSLAALNVSYIVLERLMLPIGFFAITSGIVTYGGIFKAAGIFSGLAHFIKGGIFFWYGLLTFGRWMGCFSDFGWAWNVKPGADIVGSKKSRIPSAEFTESFVIWFYGISNVGLEHLSTWGKEWSAMDLEHVSITIMFFGGGLLGMLVESKVMRKLLNTTASCTDLNIVRTGEKWQPPRSYVHSLNPLPALVIMLLGLMMSGHHQSSMVSTMLHKQWGTMFVGFALARGVTYVTFWLKPPKTYLPSRPPSELIAAFCLIGGGMIFMASNKNSVESLELYGLDAMFVFTIMMGLTALLMAWTLIVVAVKGWAVRYELRASARA